MRTGLTLLLLTTCASASVLYQYPFTSSGNFNPTSVTPFVQSLTLDTTNLNAASPCVCDDGFGVVFQSYPSNTSTSHGTALSNNSFFTITLNLMAGSSMNLTSLAYNVGKGGSGDPRGYFIRSSVDGFASDIKAVTLPTGAQAAPGADLVDLSGASYQGLSSLALRFYIWTPFPVSNSVDWNNITLNGTAQAAPGSTPEPGSLWLLVGGLTIVGAKRLKRCRTVRVP
jgi:hypothetical protein